MANRRTVRRLSDLVPDILIEAQRCDAITARKALERAAEELAYNYGFFTTTQTYSLDGNLTTERFMGVDCYVFYFDDLEVLSIEKVLALGDGSTSQVSSYKVGSDGKVYVNKQTIPSSAERLQMICSILPTVDEDVSESTALTRGRRVLLALALSDVFSMPGQVWANPERAAYWRQMFIQNLETWNYNERFRDKTGGLILTNNPFGA